MSNQNSNPNNTKKPLNGKLIAIICAAVLAAGGITTGVVLSLNGKKQPEPEESSVIVTEAPTEAVTDAETEPVTEAATEKPELTERARELLKQNPETVGWITVDKTKVDNPVVQCGDNEYYLDHSFEREPFRAGTVFMDYRDVFGADEDKQSENIILYGHNMANNTMFGSLRRYRQDLNYYKEAPFITLESNYRVYDYVIFGLVITEGSASATWRYWDMENLSMRPQFNAYVETVHQKNMVKIPVDVRYGDRLLTLSTCYSDKDDSRFLIVARRFRTGETKEDFLALLAEENETKAE
ncbi:MAG: class B sortase [Oscillospiraceae bacterium]|nr:class B sortase [Oscillospiraceae bacterium]